MKWIPICAYFLSVLYIHLRGKVRLPLKRQLVDHSTFMAPINAFMHLFSKAPRTPFVAVAELPELAPLQQNWRAIRGEAERLLALRKTGGAQDSTDPNLSAFLKNGSKQFFLKWYDAIHSSAQRLCPQTFALLQSIPSVKVATFVELPAGAELSAHRDPFAGWLRYHLGLATPNDSRCFIEVDGERHTWRDGHATIFDETYIHWAINGTASSRIVLLCDVERPMRFGWAQAVNHLFGRTFMTATSPPNETSRQDGFASKLFRVLYYIGHYRRRLKAWSMAAYNATMLALVVGTAALFYRL
jgi:beta-hydroxylase